MNENFPLSGFATSSTRSTRGSRRARGFTLIEVLVALALFTILMIIVFVPLTQATRFLAIGRTRASLQQSANGTMSQLQRDLSRAIHVYPNDVLPGVTDQRPYLDAANPTQDNNGFPYIQSGLLPATRGVGNTSRLDLLLPELDSTGSVKFPITPARTVVTYYARRLKVDQNSALGTPVVNPSWSPYDNPVVLFRAQYPYIQANGTRLNATVDTTSTRYAGAVLPWLTQGGASVYDNEFNLEPLCDDQAGSATVPIASGSHTPVTPLNVQLVAANAPWPNATPLATNNVKPNTTFNCADSNGDGKIDRVNVNLTLMNFNIANRNDGGNDRNEAISGNVNFQRFTLSQVINLPNIR